MMEILLDVDNRKKGIFGFFPEILILFGFSSKTEYF